MKGPLIDVAGAVDMHCHPHPDLFPRLADDLEVVQHAGQVGLRAVMIKCHSEPTVSRAYLAEKISPGVQVFGGIVLNRAVGGINPAAAEAALKLGAKEVWMPTVDAAYHGEMHGGTGGYDVQSSGASAPPQVGISVTDEKGDLRPETREGLDLVAQHGAILGTCHISPKEIHALVTEARSRGVEKIVITHPFFKVPNLDVEDLRTLSAQGAYAEFGYCTVSPMWHYATVTKVADAINTIGASHALLVSDTGQRHNPMPADALRIFAQSVFESGVSEEDVHTLIAVNPAELLGLPARAPAAEEGTDARV
jgi:hypothetical protein